MSSKLFSGNANQLEKISKFFLSNILFLDKKWKKIAEKKKCAKFFDKFNFFIFQVFLRNFCKALLRGRETTRKNYWVVFKKYTFFDKKMKKSLKKTVVRFCLTNYFFLIYFEFFWINVFKDLLRGIERTRKKYGIVFEKFAFFD